VLLPFGGGAPVAFLEAPLADAQIDLAGPRTRNTADGSITTTVDPVSAPSPADRPPGLRSGQAAPASPPTSETPGRGSEAVAGSGHETRTDADPID
jgi:hypothetical protein